MIDRELPLQACTSEKAGGGGIPFSAPLRLLPVPHRCFHFQSTKLNLKMGALVLTVVAITTPNSM